MAIILFNTVLKFFFGETEVEITWTAPFEIFGDFCILGAGSIAIGLVYGLIASVMFKKMRSLTLSSAVECLIIFCIAYMAYVTAELAAMSGIIALLTSGVVMAHYAWYSLSSQGQHGSYLVFQTLGLLMQAFIFSYLGVSFFSFASLDWSPALILVMFGIVIIGRMGGTVGLIGLLRFCGYESGIAWKEVFFIGHAGLIRGAIAFGLVLRIDGGDVQHRSVIVTTCLTLVVFTTVFFGATVGSMQAFLFPKEHLQEDVDSHASEHSAALHPNEEKEEADADQGSARSSRRLGCCLRTWVKLDEWILRDLLIYNYKPELRKSQQLFFDMYDQKADEVATIIKTAALDDTGDDAKSDNSAAIRRQVHALKRRGSKLMAPIATTAINADNDDKFNRALDDEKFRKQTEEAAVTDRL